ncbi:MAG: hypothetical protein J7498_11170 [Sphingobium sp.]|nr:hypothetical protein [Sphingobium sp.]
MNTKYMMVLSAALVTGFPVAAQTPVGEAPMVMPTPQQGRLILPMNTEVTLVMNEDLNSKQAREGSPFYLTVAQDVEVDGYVIIPKGARAGGEVTWRTGKGAFGKSAKMTIELRYIELRGRRIPVEGSYRQEGDGNTVATVGTVVVAAVFGALVTGKSAIIPRGRELIARTKQDLAVMVVGYAPQPQLTATPTTAFVTSQPTASGFAPSNK